MNFLNKRSYPSRRMSGFAFPHGTTLSATDITDHIDPPEESKQRAEFIGISREVFQCERYLGGKSTEEREPEMAQCKCEVLVEKIPAIRATRGRTTLISQGMSLLTKSHVDS